MPPPPSPGLAAAGGAVAQEYFPPQGPTGADPADLLPWPARSHGRFRGPFVFYSTLDRALDYFRYDVSITFTQNLPVQPYEQEVARVPGVKAVEPWGLTSGRILKADTRLAEDEASKNVLYPRAAD
jgi:hypothetical protein